MSHVGEGLGWDTNESPACGGEKIFFKVDFSLNFDPSRVKFWDEEWNLQIILNLPFLESEDWPVGSVEIRGREER